MNILTTFNKNYLPYFATMITSLSRNNEGQHDIYIISNEVMREDINALIAKGKLPSICSYHVYPFNLRELSTYPCWGYWSVEIYFKLFAHKILPETIDKILYLDCDIIVKADILPLYEMDFGNNLFIAASHIHSKLWNAMTRKFIRAKKGSTYLNCGVILMNIASMRKVVNIEEIIDYIENNKLRLSFPEQDTITALYGDKIKPIDPLIYNFTDRYFTLRKRLSTKTKVDMAWVENKVKIIHYVGKHKPWQKKYKGRLKIYWEKYYRN